MPAGANHAFADDPRLDEVFRLGMHSDDRQGGGALVPPAPRSSDDSATRQNLSGDVDHAAILTFC